MWDAAEKRVRSHGKPSRRRSSTWMVIMEWIKRVRSFLQKTVCSSTSSER